MGSEDNAVLMTLAIEDAREFQVQWEGVISQGNCFVPWPRPLASQQAVRLHVIVVGAGTTNLEAVVDFNDVDSFGRTGALLKLQPQAVEKFRLLFERAVKPPGPSAPTALMLQQVAPNTSPPEPLAAGSSP